MKKLQNAAFLASQYLLPHHLTSRLIGRLADSQLSFIRKPLIRQFASHFEIDLSEAERTEQKDYSSFNDFFTRTLKTDARPICEEPGAWVSPVDATVSQFGEIQDGQIVQAKNHNYSVEQLFGGDRTMAQRYSDGSFITLYLSPRDYHRIHMPCDARLVKTTFVPGRLFSVNALTAQSVKGLFARNERLVCEFDSEMGRFTMVLVGAMIVASIETTWAGIVAPARRKIIQTDFENVRPIHFSKGEEMGRFRLGSTVIMTFEKNQMRFHESIKNSASLKMGSRLNAEN